MTDRIQQLIKELKEECLFQKLPMFVTVAEENNNSTEYTSEILTPLYVGQQLTDDRISPMAALMSKKFRLEFEDEIKPEDIEASIAEAFYGDDEENGKENKKE